MNDDWRHAAACLIEDPELFFPIGTHPGRQTAEAKAVCRTCPVRDACLTWALETRQDFGIVGGLTEDERRTILRRAGRDATKARKSAMTPSAAHAAIAKAASVIAVEEHCQDQRTRVATLTTHGHSAGEISRRLGISARTVGRMRAQARAGAA